MNKLNKPLIVSYYTKETLYEKEVEDLIDSCDKLGLDHDIIGIENRGSWSANCCYKAEFILKMLEKHQRPVVWTDADSVIHKYPSLFETCRADVALRINDFVEETDKSKIMTGTMFINNTASAKKLMDLWKRECERKKGPLFFDQACLKSVILHYPTIVEIKRLPASYIYVVDNKAHQKELGEEKVIISHYQASRLYQKIIDEEMIEPKILKSLSTEELKELRVNMANV